MANLSVNNLTMQFNEITAVDDVSFAIEEGQFVTLLGPSGCGKTTMLFMLAGIYQPTSGEIYFGDRNVSKIPTEKRNVGLVFQNYALYPHMTVLKNIMFPLENGKVRKDTIRLETKEVTNADGTKETKEVEVKKSVYSKMTKSEMLARAEEMAKLVGIEDQLHKKPSELSEIGRASCRERV